MAGIFEGISIAAVALLLGGVTGSFGRLGDIERHLSWISVDLRASRIVEQRTAVGTPATYHMLCGKAAGKQESPLCGALAARSFTNLGRHDTLWVFLDSLIMVSRGKLGVYDRSETRPAVDRPCSGFLEAGGASS